MAGKRIPGLQRVSYRGPADWVQEVMDFDPDRIEPPPRTRTPLKTRFIRKMGKRDNLLIIIIEMDKAFSADEIALARGMTE